MSWSLLPKLVGFLIGERSIINLQQLVPQRNVGPFVSMGKVSASAVKQTTFQVGS